MTTPCYAGGEPIRLGDIVGVGYFMFGKIVCMIENGERCDDFPAHAWQDHDSGYVIQTPEGALFHCADEAEMTLIDRSA